MRIPFPTLPLLAAAALATAACGGSSGAGASDTPAPSPGEQQEGARLPFPSADPAPRESARAPTPEKEWVVSPTGNDAAAGTEAAPLRTISRALSLARPGHLIRVLPGTYAERLKLDGSVANGTAEAPITLQGEGKPRLVPGPGNGALIGVQRANWHIRGFDIDLQGRPAFGVLFSGATEGSLLADSEVHHGAYGAGVSVHGGARDVTIEGNHIHHIIRPGQDAHGVIVQPTARNVTIRDNLIHENSGDSIQCYSPDGSVPAQPATNVLIEGNDMYGNGEQSVDIKTCHNVTIRRNRMHDTTPSGNGAMVVHMSAKDILIEENDFSRSGVAIGIGGNRYGPMPSGVVIQRNLIHDMRTEGGRLGGGIRLENSEGTQVLHNTFTRLPGPALVFGHGTGGPTQSLVVKNNLFDTATAVQAGSQAPGLKMDNNLYKPGVTFQRGGSHTLAQWQAQGHDAASQEADAQLSPDTFAPSSPAAIDRGERLGFDRTCGAGPDIGAVETGC